MALLEMRQVSLSFGGLRAVHRFDLRLEGGELLGLIGPNGAGKTTVFNLASGFYQPSEGEVLLQGRNIAGMRPHQVATLGLARTFQSIRLWNSLPVLDNLCLSQHHRLHYGLVGAVLRSSGYRAQEREVRAEAARLLDILELTRYGDELPKNLPYGLQRRVEIGRALALKPRLLLLDEPAAGMNPAEIDQLIELVRWIRREFGLTIWLIEHQMRVVMNLCEHIRVLDFGETIAEGTPGQVRGNPRVIEAYLGNAEAAHA